VAAAADAMYIPYDAERGIHPQDANFLEKEVWDFAGTPKDRYPLLLHYHPLVIYRHQVIKQADVVLAMVLLSDEFSLEQKRRNFEYYDPLTTGDSSLSACVQAILASEIGYEDKALEYFQYAVLMDLADVAGNVVDGAHIASTGGVWMALTYGFGGMRDHHGRLSFDPRLPTPWRRCASTCASRTASSWSRSPTVASGSADRGRAAHHRGPRPRDHARARRADRSTPASCRSRCSTTARRRSGSSPSPPAGARCSGGRR
jgi:trehalose/maltose hydrolase-like predicted phosphorylase